MYSERCIKKTNNWISQITAHLQMSEVLAALASYNLNLQASIWGTTERKKKLNYAKALIWQFSSHSWGLPAICLSVCVGVVMPVWSFWSSEQSIVQSDNPIKETGPA